MLRTSHCGRDNLGSNPSVGILSCCWVWPTVLSWCHLFEGVENKAIQVPFGPLIQRVWVQVPQGIFLLPMAHLGILACSTGYSSVGRASDCRLCRHQMAPGSIPGGRTLREEEDELPIPLTTRTTSKVSENLASALIFGPHAILVQRRVRHTTTARFASCSRTVWPSGVRRWFQAPVRKGVGSNPTAVTFSNDQVTDVCANAWKTTIDRMLFCTGTLLPSRHGQTPTGLALCRAS